MIGAFTRGMRVNARRRSCKQTETTPGVAIAGVSAGNSAFWGESF